MLFPADGYGKKASKMPKIKCRIIRKPKIDAASQLATQTKIQEIYNKKFIEPCEELYAGLEGKQKEWVDDNWREILDQAFETVALMIEDWDAHLED